MQEQLGSGVLGEWRGWSAWSWWKTHQQWVDWPGGWFWRSGGGLLRIVSNWRNWVWRCFVGVRRFSSVVGREKKGGVVFIQAQKGAVVEEERGGKVETELEDMASEETADPPTTATSGKGQKKGGREKNRGGWNRFFKLRSGKRSGKTPPDPPVAGRQVHTAGLPRELPSAWADRAGFGGGQLNLGEVSAVRIASFEQLWNSGTGQSGASFYNPVGIPDGYSSVGCYAQLNAIPPRGWALAVAGSFDGPSPPLAKPTDFTLVWSSADWSDAPQEVLAFFWAPVVPSGYTALGYVVTNLPDKPGKDDIVLVREDLTDVCVVDIAVWDTSELEGVPPFSAWITKPAEVGKDATGIPANTFYCNSSLSAETPLPVACLKNVNGVLDLMPTLAQLGEVMSTFGPTVYCHPEEEYLPTSPDWFFENGALLYSAADPNSPVRVAPGGANLPHGGLGNDYEYWLDLPNDGTGDVVKKGNLSVAKVLVHVKPMFGGIYTDLSCWIYHCFNGSSIAKVGVLKTLSLGKIGEHVSDWEHFVVRIDNFSGELRQIYMSEHAAGVWFRPDELEFIHENRAVVYSAKNSHALYSKEGNNLQGDEKLGVGIRNDTSKSSLIIDASVQYEFINVDYLSDKGETGYPEQPAWVDYMREWGPKITYDAKTELDRILKLLPKVFRNSLMAILNKLPVELGGEEGPTGPKEKTSWLGDEKVF